MPPNKRKLDFFDPNKSDSDDENFAPGQERSPKKVSRKSTSKSVKRGGSGKRQRTRYRGSDVEDDDDVSDSLLEDSFSEESEEEEGADAMTGRRKRTVAKKEVNYEEPDDEIEGLHDDSSSDSDDSSSPAKRSKPAAAPSRIVKLKLPGIALSNPPSRTTRAGSTARSNIITAPIRRSTRANTEDADELVELSNSGNHAIRASRSPEPIGRQSRGAKGLKKPSTSMIVEEPHETSSFEHAASADRAVETTMKIPEEDEVEEVMDQADDADADEDELAQESAPHAQIEEHAVAEVNDDDDDEDDDDVPVISRRTRGSRPSISAAVPDVQEEAVSMSGNRRLTRARTKPAHEPSSDFDPQESAEEDEDISETDASPQKKDGDDYDSSARGRRGARGNNRSNKSSRRRGGISDSEEEVDADEVMEEALELKSSRRRKPTRTDPDIMYERPSRRNHKQVDYTIKPMDAIYAADEDAEDVAPTPSRKARNGRAGASQPWERNLHTAYGPFGGAGGAPPVIGGPWGTGAAGGADSDSSDDEGMQKPVSGAVGMTPTAAGMPGLLPGMGQTNNVEAAAVGGAGGNTANFGRVKSLKALADADPLGVDQNVDFSKVGGLAGHIDQLKEMVQMPLLYPELFLKFHVTPPRGVLFHGPPGTGKTLLARALAASVGSGGRKITFYMRKGADALSKWVGEAERQLRLLFEEARKTQPSIIFFDEIDGLAPVRSSKQEQIHASIVSTLLALMDGMDGRGQVIVIGATNRPDNIDPALRRPGRFDREFYFPLPGAEARKSIINIHTQDWGIDEAFKDNLAQATKGYGGADLRALCTEAALNSIQRTYPQIYSSNEKLILDADKIKVTAKDFMLSIKKMVPSSERATSSGATPLPKVVEPLLREQLRAIEDILDGLIPVKKKTTALEEAMYEQYDDEDQGFGRETLQQEFEKSRVFRPRLLIGGQPGMGQAYLGAALLNHFEGLHVQNFDLPTIFADSARSAETAIVQLFAEVKRHKPSVIYLPGIETWYATLSESVITTFLGLLRAIPPTDPVLVLGICDSSPDKVDPRMLRDLFGFSRKNQFIIDRPSQAVREEFFQNIITYIRTAPNNFPDPVNRKKRKLEVLEIAPPPPPREVTKEEIKAIKKRDHILLNNLKVLIQPVMDQIQRRYRKFRNPAIPAMQIQYLYDEQDPNYVRPDVVQFRPFELAKDKNGVMGLRETATNKFFYNLETTTIEERLANGYYCRPKDFLFDIKSLAKDARQLGDKERILRTNELLSNVEVDMANFEAVPAMAECENVYQRQVQRTKEKEEKHRKRLQAEASPFPPAPEEIAQHESENAITLGPAPSRRLDSHGTPFTTPSSLSNGHSVLTNGTPSQGANTGSGHDDTHMGGTDESQQESPFSVNHSTPHTASTWPPQMGRGPSNLSSQLARGSTQGISQTSGFQEIPHGVSPASFINDASTTTSGKRTSDGTNTQNTNGQQHSPFGAKYTDSQLPDTQPEGEQKQSQGQSSGEKDYPHSQAHAIAKGTLKVGLPSETPSSASQEMLPPPHPASLHDKQGPQNSVAGEASSQPASSQPSTHDELLLDEQCFENLHKKFTRATSGCSIEQLEQINRELMDELWKMRGEWNRVGVANRLAKVFSDTIDDIENMQRILQQSQDSQEAMIPSMQDWPRGR